MKKTLYCIITFLCIGLFCVFLTSCSSTTKTEITADTSELTITDMGGDLVTLPNEISRVISTSDPCTDMLIAFGQGDKLVGAYYRALDNPWFEKFYPDAVDLIRIDSYEPEAEALISMDIDLIFVPSRERAQSLREKGICAITIRYYSPEEMVGAANLLGKIFGGAAAEKGKQWIQDFESAITLISEKTADMEENKKPVAYEILADKNRGPFRTYYGDNQAWLSYAGGVLATKDFADATSQAMPTEESVLATNPDIIFIGGTYATKEYTDLLQNEMWKDINAVKNKNIFIEPTGATAWNSCSTTYPLLVYYCFSSMYPDRVDFSIEEIAHDFYLKYYGVDFTDESISLMMQSLAPDGSEMWADLVTDK